MKQLTILVDNKVGVMAEILSVLGENNVNVRGISTERGQLNEIRLIVDNPQQAKDILEKKKPYVVHLVDVVVLKLKDTPGELAKATKTLEDHKINIEYAYGFGREGEYGLVALWTSKPPEEVRNVLVGFLTD
jgi:hypothetical protein